MSYLSAKNYKLKAVNSSEFTAFTILVSFLKDVPFGKDIIDDDDNHIINDFD